MVAINAFSDGLNRFNCPKCLEFQYNTAQIFPQLLKINMNTSDNNMFERIFKLRENGTNVRTEVMAGLTTFLTMCYIIIVNPLILGEAGMDVGAVFVATCIAAAIGCFVTKRDNWFKGSAGDDAGSTQRGGHSHHCSGVRQEAGAS